MARQRLEFHCVCGQLGSAPPADPNGWSSIAAYGNHSCIRWHDTRELALVVDPPIDCLAHPPELGGVYWGVFGMPFAAQTADTFWIIYDSPTAYWNGVLDDPDEMVSTHLVRCKLLGWEKLEDGRIIGQLQALELIALRGLLEYPAVPMLHNPIAVPRIARVSTARHEDLWLMEHNIQGDDGEWFILSGEHRPTHLLMHGIWGAHEDYVWAGHGLFNDEQANLALRYFHAADD